MAVAATAPRVICFFDGSNLHSRLTEAFGAGKVHLPRLCHQLVGPGRRLLEWRYYAAPVPQGTTPDERARYAGQQRFFAFVQRHRKGVLRQGRFQRGDDGRLREKGVDVLLAIDLVRLAADGRYDVAIVLSADGDIVPAVEMARQVYGRRVEVALPAEADAHHMRGACDADLVITEALYESVRI